MLGHAEQHHRLEHHRPVAQVRPVGSAELAVGRDRHRPSRRERPRRLGLRGELVGGGEPPLRGHGQARPLAQLVHGGQLGRAHEREREEPVGLGELGLALARHPTPGAPALEGGPLVEEARGREVPRLLRLDREVAGVVRGPVRRVVVAGPVTEAAVRGLEAAQPLERRLHVRLHAGLLLRRELEELPEEELREGGGDGLLDAAVRVGQQVLEPPAEVDGRHARDLERRLVRAGEAGERPLGRPALARLDRPAENVGDARGRAAHVELDLLARALGPGRGGDGGGGDPEAGLRLQAEVDHLVAHRREGQRLLRLVHHLERDRRWRRRAPRPSPSAPARRRRRAAPRSRRGPGRAAGWRGASAAAARRRTSRRRRRPRRARPPPSRAPRPRTAGSRSGACPWPSPRGGRAPGSGPWAGSGWRGGPWRRRPLRRRRPRASAPSPRRRRRPPRRRGPRCAPRAPRGHRSGPTGWGSRSGSGRGAPRPPPPACRPWAGRSLRARSAWTSSPAPGPPGPRGRAGAASAGSPP